jgi:hypothetical protein
MNKDNEEYKPERILPWIAVFFVIEAIGMYLLCKYGYIPM